MSDPQRPADPLGSLTTSWPLLMGLGVLGVIAGIVVLIDPGGTLVTLAWVAGVFLVVDGLLALFGAFGGGRGASGAAGRPGAGGSPLRWLGVLWVIVGLYLVIEPVSGVLAVALVLGIWLVVRGVMRAVDAFRRGESDRVWHLVVGIVEVLAGLVIVVWPGIGVVTVALFVGLAFLLRGFGEISAAWALRAAHR